MSDPIKVIARGGQPEWEHEFDHPEYGAITFRAHLPTATQLVEQSVAVDNLLAELSPSVEPRSATVMLASAITGLQHVMTLPVVGEDRVTDEESGHEVIHQRHYDPAAETDTGFLVGVWAEFWLWRQSQIERVEELKNSSGETNGNGSSESSTATTGSPSTIPA